MLYNRITHYQMIKGFLILKWPASTSYGQLTLLIEQSVQPKKHSASVNQIKEVSELTALSTTLTVGPVAQLDYTCYVIHQF